jgi:MFS transporter
MSDFRGRKRGILTAGGPPDGRFSIPVEDGILFVGVSTFGLYALRSAKTYARASLTRMNEKAVPETSGPAAAQPEQHPIDAEFAPIARRPRSDDDVTPANDPVPVPGEKTLTRTSSGPAYTVFSRGTRRWMVAMATVASFVSPMTATIYYPALDALSAELRVTIAMINFTITSYMILQALAPTFYGDLGDMTGRRPALMLAVGIYTLANVGLALQRNYAALLVLRMLQSAGGSGTIPLGIAVVADITTSAERGKYMGILLCGINVGPTLGKS